MSNNSSLLPYSFLDYTPWECELLTFGFGISALVGSLFHVFVLVVLLHKIFHEPNRNKTAPDQLIAFLTLIDLVACSILFPLEVIHFNHDDCNVDQPLKDKFITFLLEASSTFALLNIAINRYVMVCHATKFQMTWCTSLFMNVGNFALSVVAAIVAMFFLEIQPELTMIIYIIIILTIMFSMILLYALIFTKLYQRTLLARNRLRRSSLSTQQQQQQKQHQTGRNLKVSTDDSVSKTPSPPHAAPTSQIELMMIHSAKIFVVVTAVYIVCFLPNATLTIFYVILGPAFVMTRRHFLIELFIKYINLFYNINFILMPLVYTALSRQFWVDCKQMLAKFSGRGGSARTANNFTKSSAIPMAKTELTPVTNC